MEIVIEVLRGIGRLFINPLLYIAILGAIFLGYVRVKRERSFFHIRLLSGWTELRYSFFMSIIPSIVLSVLLVVAGVVVEPQVLLVLIAVSIVALASFVYHFLSGAVLLAVTGLVLIIFAQVDAQFTIFGTDIVGMGWTDAVLAPICVLAGLLVVAEALFIRHSAADMATPIVEKTKRGLHAVAYLSKQLWVLPLVVLIPGDLVPSFVPYWPQFTLGAESFSFVIFPFVIGFQQLARKTLPVHLYGKLAQIVRYVGVLLIIGGIAGYFVEEVAFVVLMVGAVARLLIALAYKLAERNDVYAVAATPTGAMIVSVLPNSPAEKMGLIAGEVIKRVNGHEVRDEKTLYEALQINAAHCKLEVLNHDKEIRLTQHVVHSDDHHSIGLILAQLT